MMNRQTDAEEGENNMSRDHEGGWGGGDMSPDPKGWRQNS